MTRNICNSPFVAGGSHPKILYSCELSFGHDGWHRAGSVTWHNNCGDQRAGKQASAEPTCAMCKAGWPTATFHRDPKGIIFADPCGAVPAPVSALREAAKDAEYALRNMMSICRKWAKESRDGGWSTHQVDANNVAAIHLEEVTKRLAAALRETPDA